MKDPDYRSIRLDVSGGVATITFNVPQYRNALDIAALEELLDAFYRVEHMDEAGAIVLTGEGDAFCAGINLKEIPWEGGDMAEIAHHFRYKAMWWHQIVHKITRIGKPVLAAVNGIAAGGGFGMVLAADIAICNENARFLCSWHSNGIANDGATSYTLSRIVGFRRAMELMLTNRTLGAEEAHEWQIVNRVYPNGEFAKRVAETAADLAAGPTHLQAMAKERFHEGWRQSIEECTEYEIQNILESLGDPYFRRRVERFNTKEGRNDALIVRLP